MHQKKNLTGMCVVAAMHLALLAAFLNTSKIVVWMPKAPVVDVVPYVEPPQPKLRDPEMSLPPQLKPPVYVPVPEVPTLLPTQPTVTTQTTPDVLPSPSPPAGAYDGTPKATPATRAAPLHVAAVVDSNACAKPDYPKTALRNGDTGVVTLALLIGTDGRVADSKVERSSGFRELDRAAQVGLGLCRFAPGTVDGVPQQSWTRMQYVWSLDD